MPASRVRTRCQPGAGQLGWIDVCVYSSGPIRAAADGEPTARARSAAPSPELAADPSSACTCEEPGHRNLRRRSRSTIIGADREQRPRAAGRLRPVLDEPAALAGDRRQPGLGVDGDREADRLEQRQVARRVGVGDASSRSRPSAAQ